MRNAHVQTILAKLMSYLPPSDDVTYHRQYIQVSASFIIFLSFWYVVQDRGNVFSRVCGIGQGKEVPIPYQKAITWCNEAWPRSHPTGTNYEGDPRLVSQQVGQGSGRLSCC